ncbi:MAG: phosphoribosylformylglycinamidine synthase I [Candidatus Komeilibacteria bacterium]|nr:phosphoribosylformylglycinamidine synthase I [Candidatus Komeilibacteria bacterium]
MSDLFKIAIIIFPGTNCHEESFRAIKNVGMLPEFFRWNDDYVKLKEFDGYFIPGGFSYEDRVRSGAIAGRDPLMKVIKEEAGKGKPIIGICNGAQILVESGLIPGLKDCHLGAGLAWNNHGYLNIWTRIKNESEPGRSAFNNFEQGNHFALPIAHGEGRWVIPEDLLKQLEESGQAVFKYCDASGEEKNEFSINPNGAVHNLAGVCNQAGNVLALMPHPERTKDGLVIFDSMKHYLENNKAKTGRGATRCALAKFCALKEESIINEYQKTNDSLEILVDLIITDNEAQTLETALTGLGYNNIKVSRMAHWEVETSEQSAKFIDELIKSGELLNTNKEIPYINDSSKLKAQSHKLLVRYAADFVGQGKVSTLTNRLGFKQIKSIKQGVLWSIDCSAADWQKILASNILANPYSQETLIYK